MKPNHHRHNKWSTCILASIFNNLGTWGHERSLCVHPGKPKFLRVAVVIFHLLCGPWSGTLRLRDTFSEDRIVQVKKFRGHLGQGHIVMVITFIAFLAPFTKTFINLTLPLLYIFHTFKSHPILF